MSTITNEKENLADNNKNLSKSSFNSKSKRPTQTLYIPKHLRNEEKKSLNNNICIQNTTINGATTSNNTSAIEKSNSPIIDPSIIGYITDSKLNNLTESCNGQVNDENSILNKLANLEISTKPFTESNDNINHSNGTDIKISHSQIEQPNKVSEIQVNTNNNNNKTNKPKKIEDDWFDMYDDLGQCLDNKLVKKTNQLEEKKEEQKVIDYTNFEPQTEALDEEEFGHILEIYDFPVEFKNENIISCIKECIGHVDFDLKWVDDTHCLGVFSSASMVSNVIKQNTNPLVKTRPLSKATADSKRRAQRLVNYLKPYKPRPQTTSFVASRLIGASLGLNSLISKDKQKQEKKKLDSARATKRNDREIKDAVWNGK